MASLIQGKLAEIPVATNSEAGEFIRADSIFRGQISTSDAQAHRYHLFVSYACPWAHRTLITRKLKGLEEIISVSVVEPFMGKKGWSFDDEGPYRFLYEVYLAEDESYTGKITVPVLWDSFRESIINNESSEIIRIFNDSFDLITDSKIDLYPEHLRQEIETINHNVYHHINNGVYKSGFATSQKIYERECLALFKALDEMEILLGQRRFLTGDKITEADIRLYTTLVRFDVVYHGHFKCNIRRIKDYPHLWDYLKCLYQIPAFRETTHFDHIKQHYYQSHDFINPTRIVPLGPILELETEHSRGTPAFHFKMN
jgi:glutathionyl-hydroquinone reductase